MQGFFKMDPSSNYAPLCRGRIVGGQVCRGYTGHGLGVWCIDEASAPLTMIDGLLYMQIHRSLPSTVRMAGKNSPHEHTGLKLCVQCIPRLLKY